jgi:hypothetical protein
MRFLWQWPRAVITLLTQILAEQRKTNALLAASSIAPKAASSKILLGTPVQQ